MSARTQGIQISTSESSKRLVDFLESTDLHKKDFAEMIGVTLSYVYSLIDNTIPFSTRIGAKLFARLSSDCFCKY